MNKEIRINNRYLVHASKIGHGSFGDIYAGYDTQTDQQVAVKLEQLRCTKPQLRHEYSVYRAIAGGGVPSVMWCGSEGDYVIMVMDLLGPNLQQLLDLCSGRMSLKTVLMLAEQMLTRVEYLHRKEFVHRDIKPQNFLLGREGVKANTVHLIDYGLSKSIRDPETGGHIKCIRHQSLIGTARYASLSTHAGWEQGRKDDLESLCYVFVYLLKGELPWMGAKGANKTGKEKNIFDSKNETPIDTLCQGIPREFAEMLKYCRGLKFEDQPDYNYLHSLIRNAVARDRIELDFVFDWTLMKLKEYEDKLVERAARLSPCRDSPNRAIPAATPPATPQGEVVAPAQQT